MTKNRMIGIVVGSTRPQRLCKGIAEWVLATAGRESQRTYELIDLAQMGLPFLDEALMASLGRYEHEHTKRWSRLVNSYAGFVYVMLQYSWGHPGVLKNARDFPYAEWHDKGAGTITYGTHGGNKGADQLHSVLQGLGMRFVTTNPRLHTPSDTLTGPGDARDIDFTPFEAAVQALNRELTELLAT